MTPFFSQIANRFKDVIEGNIKEVELPWPILTRIGNPLMPGACMLLCGTPGASKSFMMLQAIKYWQNAEVKACIYELEEDRVFHMTRMLAQASGFSKLTSYSWLRDNPDKARKALVDHRTLLDTAESFMCESPNLPPSMGSLAIWVESKAVEGYRVICIDPITIAATESNRSWEEEKSFLQAMGRICSKYQCSVVLVTHPKTGADQKPDLAYLAGSAAYPRFCQTVLWLEYHEPKESNYRTALGTTSGTHNRSLHVIKARNGRGHGMKVAFDFGSDTLKLRELGIIVK